MHRAKWQAALALVAALVLAPAAASAQPITLTLAYFSSDRSNIYLTAIRPFVEAVNADAAGLVRIDVRFSGELGPNPTQQLDLVRNGIADLAFVIPGYTPTLFRENAVLELPGIFRNIREATLVYNRLIAANLLAGYEDLFLVGAFATAPQSIHTVTPVTSISDLVGKRIRVNNAMEGAAFARLGMVPVLLPINQVSGALTRGEIDGAAVPPSAMIEFGISRVAVHHYLLGVASAPLSIMMDRARFESLPPAVQDVIRRYSGEWLAEHFVAGFELLDQLALNELLAEPARTVIVPTDADWEIARAAFDIELAEWLAADARNAELHRMVVEELGRIRLGQ
jgi:TRAP-type C4-dicarboxylate transport system substrate-binding protein